MDTHLGRSVALYEDIAHDSIGTQSYNVYECCGVV